MARQEGQLLINLKTNYPDVVVDMGKIVLGERSRKKSSCDQKRQRKELCKAVCALLNSGGGVVRMESEDKNYRFQEHGIGLDIEESLRECIDCTETSEYFTWMQQRSHLLLFVKTWSCGGPEQKSEATKPRICSLSTGLSCRCFTSVVRMTSSNAARFLREKESCAKCPENRPGTKNTLRNSDGGAKETPANTEECDIQDAAAGVLKRDKLMVGEVLDFTETTHIEFKNFATENILEYVRKTLPNYVSAFANTQGGYLFFGVNDSREVIGSHSKVGKEALEKTVSDTMGSMLVHHFCGSQAGVQYKTHILNVYDNAGLQGYVCVVRVEPFCCAVFYDNPESWIVMDDTIERLSIRKWTELMTAADPDLSNQAGKFQNELSLSNGPPLIKPVYSIRGLQCVSELQECLYPGAQEMLQAGCSIWFNHRSLPVAATYLSEEYLNNEKADRKEAQVPPKRLFLTPFRSQACLKHGVYTSYSYKKILADSPPVGFNEIKWMPKTICTDLFSEYHGLEDLMKKQIHPLNKGVLIFSRSWAVDIGLRKKQDAVCDVLLVAENAYPVLYTVVKDASSAESENLRETAYALKQKLVNDGGYASKVCVIPQILHLNGTKNQMEVAEDDVPQQENQENLCGYTSLYPENYILTSRDIPAFLRALVIVVLCFKSYLSDHLGCEIFNLLTLRQYELLSKNLHKAKEQFVIGLPGTGKTIVALKIIERIKNIFHCSAKEILYVCGKQPLKNFVRNEICQTVTHLAFSKGNFPEVKHIVVDEAQNFHYKENWYQRARELVKKQSGIFWVFLDFFQSTCPYGCGLDFSELYPQEWLTKVVRNAKQIYNFMVHIMDSILQKRKTVMPYEVLEELFKQAECAHSLSGDCIIKTNMEIFEMAKYVTRQCKSYIQQGYAIKDIAILCSTKHLAWVFGMILKRELKRKVRKCRVRWSLGPADDVLEDVIVLDSIRRFSGLERKIVFGIHPVPLQDEMSLNLLLCVASRANTKLHLLYHKRDNALVSILAFKLHFTLT